MTDLEELARAAKEQAPEDFSFEEWVADAIKSYENLMRAGDRLITFDYASIIARCAEELGREPTDIERKQAILNAVLEQKEGENGQTTRTISC